MPVPVSFWGTSDISTKLLKSLLSDPRFEVKYVLTRKDKPRSQRGRKILPTPVKAFAIEKGIKVFTPDSLRDPAFQESLKQFEIRFHVVLAYGKIIPREIFEEPLMGAVNFHASLLPELRGASPIESALLEGHQKTGWSLQKINVGLDTGDILHQSALDIDWEDDRSSLYLKLNELLLSEANDMLYSFSQGKLRAVPQNEEKATFSGKLHPGSGNIHWKESARRIRNQARALTPEPSVFTYFKNKRIKIFFNLKAPPDEIQKIRYESPPGSMIIEKQTLSIVCGDGFALPIERVQFNGKPKIQVQDFINGYLNKAEYRHTNMASQDRPFFSSVY